MDKIHIKNLEVFAYHGVFEEEKRLGQKFIISATLYTNTRIAGKTDSILDSIHYGEVSLFMKNFLENNTFNLLETVVEKLAEEMLLNIPFLQKVDLKLEKPWAPVLLHLETVAVEITRQWHDVYIALGSNMGDKQNYIDTAINKLNDTKGIDVVKKSSFIVTKPYGVVEQDDFLNGCINIRTLFTPNELLTLINQIELEANRVRVIKWGERTLDLDIIFYDDLIYDSENLTIPHKEMHKRSFVLEPLNEIASFKRHPILMKSVEEMLNELN